MTAVLESDIFQVRPASSLRHMPPGLHSHSRAWYSHPPPHTGLIHRKARRLFSPDQACQSIYRKYSSSCCRHPQFFRHHHRCLQRRNSFCFYNTSHRAATAPRKGPISRYWLPLISCSSWLTTAGAAGFFFWAIATEKKRGKGQVSNFSYTVIEHEIYAKKAKECFLPAAKSGELQMTRSNTENTEYKPRIARIYTDRLPAAKGWPLNTKRHEGPLNPC